ncbi:twin-arginine translocase TatA/TatE family subunit [Microbacterium sp. BK668]|uniref:twin-arginine translocase TatA/TatE family subunit n=1 Tax=Microbacterium sp. BK668 TaxID=2512118 RepID=UPI00105F7F7B|nr:twin-arginine translocase TatA/TatE family subunit [Microbacterium sp. BK668]TDN93016.1 sec-independent protein translocase protein TatA [Microbacterium sp. BK668]
MFSNLNGWHLLILLAVILLLFGAAKLPALAKSVGQSARVFRGEMKAMKEEDEKPSAADGTASSTATDAAAAPATTRPADTPDTKP